MRAQEPRLNCDRVFWDVNADRSTKQRDVDLPCNHQLSCEASTIHRSDSCDQLPKTPRSSYTTDKAELDRPGHIVSCVEVRRVSAGRRYYDRGELPEP